ncbi:MAG: hypothetical protein Alpg2KO_02870 [Alphaproteobacteria bacterium]
MGDNRKIWIVSDGIPGHVNTVRGLAAELSQRSGLECVEYRLFSRYGLLTRWATTLLKRSGYAPSGMWRLSPVPDADQRPALILSAGGRTGLANIALARKWGCPNAYFSSLRGLPASGFSACFTILAEQATAANIHLLPISSSHVTAQAIDEYGQSLRQTLDIEDPSPVWTILLGGDAPGYRYLKQDWQAMANGLSAASQKAGAKLLITGSRRTPQMAIDMLERVLPKDCILRTQWEPSKQPLDRLEAYLGAADQVIVTDDSTSMISDSLLTRKPVTSLYPAIAGNALDRDQKIRQGFVASGHLRRLPVQQADKLAAHWDDDFTALPADAEWTALDHLMPLLEINR